MSQPKKSSRPQRLALLWRLVIVALAVVALRAAFSLLGSSASGGSSLQLLKNWQQTPARKNATGESLKADTSGEQVQESLRRALVRLNASEARLVYYHVSKSGGTSMCYAVVKANSPLMGCLSAFKDIVVAHHSNTRCNCNGIKELQPPIFATGGSDEEVEAYLRGRRPVAFFDEHGVADSPYFGPMLVHAIVVRNPMRRYVSNLLHYLDKPYNKPLSEVDVSAAVLHASALQHGEQGFIWDNYLTRYAGGFSRKRDAVVTQEHYEAALRNLERMQVVLVLEEAASAAPLLTALGLQPFSEKTRAGTRATQMGKHDELSAEAEQRLRELHRFDLKLYEWCLRRHKLVVEAFQRLQQQH